MYTKTHTRAQTHHKRKYMYTHIPQCECIYTVRVRQFLISATAFSANELWIVFIAFKIANQPLGHREQSWTRYATVPQPPSSSFSRSFPPPTPIYIRHSFISMFAMQRAASIASYFNMDTFDLLILVWFNISFENYFDLNDCYWSYWRDKPRPLLCLHAPSSSHVLVMIIG